MASTSQSQKGPNPHIARLDTAINCLSLVEGHTGIPPAEAALGVSIIILTAIRNTLAREEDFVDFGLEWSEKVGLIERELSGMQSDGLSQSVVDALDQMTTTLNQIKEEIDKLGKRNMVSRAWNAGSDKDKIARWRQDLDRHLEVFKIGLAIDTYKHAADTSRKGREGAIGPAQVSVPDPGESLPPPPRTCFGRDELIEEIVGLAENLEPIALIGTGGIGKTSIALAVLHHDRIKDRFGKNRRFIHCDQFSASRVHFLARLSEVVGATGVKCPKDLNPLRPFLSQTEMILFLDNAESILDTQGTDSREIHALVEELSRFEKICLVITSRIATVPPHCKRPTIPTLSMESACDIFYAIYSNGGRSNIISDLIKELDFHALSITLLAATAFHNSWDYDRLAQEWSKHRVGVLRTGDGKSLKQAIDLSLTSPTFRQLIPPSKSHKLVDSPTVSKLIPSMILHKIPPSARELLEVVAFLPQGIDEENLDWLFPTTSDRQNIFDTFCVLSLTHRNNGFIKMLSPIRDYLRPQDPRSSTLLRATKDRYLTRLSVVVLDPGTRGFEEAKWIKSEDINVEYLLDVFTSIDTKAHDVWRACGHFMEHLYWHKPRQTVLGPKIEGLPDGHRSKAKCLFELARLLGSIGNRTEEKRLFIHTLSLWRAGWNYFQVARTLWHLSEVNRKLGLYKEGIQQAEEVLGIAKRFRHTEGQVHCLRLLAWLLLEDGQLDAAESAALRMIDLLPEKGQEFLLCQSHTTLANIRLRIGKKVKAINHFETGLQIASRFDWQDELSGIHQDLARLLLAEDELDNANTHIEQAKSHAVDDTYNLGCAMKLQARIWYRQCRHEEARSETLATLEIYEKLGAVEDVEDCKDLLREIEQAMES